MGGDECSPDGLGATVYTCSFLEFLCISSPHPHVHVSWSWLGILKNAFSQFSPSPSCSLLPLSHTSLSWIFVCCLCTICVHAHVANIVNVGGTQCMHFIRFLLLLFLLFFLCHTQAYEVVLGDFLSLYKLPNRGMWCWLIFLHTCIFVCYSVQCVYTHMQLILSMWGTHNVSRCQ